MIICLPFTDAKELYDLIQTTDRLGHRECMVSNLGSPVRLLHDDRDVERNRGRHQRRRRRWRRGCAVLEPPEVRRLARFQLRLGGQQG